MSRIDVFNKVREYPDDDKEYSILTIKNHWNDRKKVVLQVNNDEEMIFYADDIIQAIQNAMNAH